MKLAALVFASLVSLASVARADADRPYDGPPGAMPMPGEVAVEPAPLATEMPPGELASLPPGAQPGPGMRGPRGPRGNGGMRNGALRQALLARFDKNHDGQLEPRERRQAARALRRIARQLMRQGHAGQGGQGGQRAARLNGVIQRYDLNGDGRVGPGEMPPAMARKLRHLDRNGDGWVDNADFGR